MNYIGHGGLDDWESGYIIVDINMHKLKSEVKKVRDIIENNDFITMVEIGANDPDEVSEEVFDALGLESYQLYRFRGEYEEKPEHYLRYASFEVTKWSVYYVCSPKHWNGRLSLSIEVKE